MAKEKTPPNIQTMVRKLKCSRCGKSVIRGPRLVVKGAWMCASCAYEMEHGEAKKVRKSKVSRQEEHLFPLPEPIKKEPERS